MRVAIFSDVHANLPALEAFVAATRDAVDGYICLGDVVNYGPWNDACVEIVASLPNVTYLEGNHERLFLGLEPVAHEIPLVQEFLAHSLPRFTQVDRIRNLPLATTLGRYTCVHTIGLTQRIYPDTVVDVDRSYVIGHTHRQFRTQCRQHEVVNCGSVGQNRGFIDLAQYAIYDADRDELSLREQPYAFGVFLRELIACGYPEACVDYYRKKNRSRRRGDARVRCVSPTPDSTLAPRRQPDDAVVRRPRDRAD